MIIRDQVVFFIGLGSILFYQLNSYNNERLLSIIIIVIFGFSAYYYLDKQYKNLDKDNNIIETVINKESEISNLII